MQSLFCDLLAVALHLEHCLSSTAALSARAIETHQPVLSYHGLAQVCIRLEACETSIRLTCKMKFELHSSAKPRLPLGDGSVSTTPCKAFLSSDREILSITTNILRNGAAVNVMSRGLLNVNLHPLTRVGCISSILVWSQHAVEACWSVCSRT